MRILITGVTGQVGFELLRACQPVGEVIGVNARSLDLTRADDIRRRLSEARPDVIINAAAYTAVDRAESEEPVAHAINSTAVAVMAEEARKGGTLLIHYSTDQVFDGTKPEPYAVDDAPAPLNAYGRTKLAGEQALKGSDCDFLCLRTSWVYASRGHNFLLTILKLAQQQDELPVVADQIGAPTTARLLADLTVQVLTAAMAERQRGDFRSELLHVTAAGATSRHGFAEALLASACALGLVPQALRLVPIATSAYPAAARRPLNSRLDCSRILQRYSVQLPAWQDGLRLCLEELV